jgi:hypothetical protein
MPFAYPVQLVNSCLSMLSRRALLGLGAVLLTSPINARPRRRYEYEDDEWLYDDPAQTPGTGFYNGYPLLLRVPLPRVCRTGCMEC